jgi:hypothetical protein
MHVEVCVRVCVRARRRVDVRDLKKYILVFMYA